MLRSDRPLAARHLFFVSGIIFIVYAVFTSSGTGNLPNGAIHYWFLVLAIGAFYIFTDKKIVSKYIYIIFGAVGFLVIEYGAIDTLPIEPIPKELQKVSYRANVMMVVLTLILITRFFVKDISTAELNLVRANERMRQLLENILPESIARRLEDSGRAFAMAQEHSTVLFADLVGFTPLANSMEPNELVRMLNGLFSEFDRLTELHGFEKIKTIGDAYMAASGVPIAQPNHAELIAKMAVDMVASIKRYPDLDIRIGIHSGPVIAGVIGKKRLTFDLWGDTVNIASRMESHGIPGMIQISQDTRKLLGDKYVCEERGVIDVKGKGEMKLFLLKGLARTELKDLAQS